MVGNVTNKPEYKFGPENGEFRRPSKIASSLENVTNKPGYKFGPANGKFRRPSKIASWLENVTNKPGYKFGPANGEFRQPSKTIEGCVCVRARAYAFACACIHIKLSDCTISTYKSHILDSFSRLWSLETLKRFELLISKIILCMCNEFFLQQVVTNSLYSWTSSNV